MSESYGLRTLPTPEAREAAEAVLRRMIQPGSSVLAVNVAAYIKDDTGFDVNLTSIYNWAKYHVPSAVVSCADERAPAEPSDVIFDVDTPVPDLDALKEQNRLLTAANSRIFKQLARAKERNADLVAATYQGAFDAMTAFGSYKPVVLQPYGTSKGDHSPEAVLWHLTDWQGSKKTTSYNTDVMFERLRNFLRKSTIITEIGRQDHPVTRCVICFGGDMIEGLFNFPAQAFEIDQTLFGQITSVSRLLVEVVQYALASYDEVEVIAEWGNHGRIGSKRDNVPRSDNFDRMAYEMARQWLREETRLVWEDCPEDIQRVEIGNYRALLIHGDEVGRGGTVADNQMMNFVNRWKAGAYKWDFRDVYIGHYHQHKELPMANGEGSLFFTGSTESDNRYARDSMAASASPTQRIHGIDLQKGRVTSQYKVYVE